MNKRKCIGWIVVSFFCAAGIGCGGSTAQLAGKVTHQGEPVSGADIAVEALADDSMQFFGVTTEDGSIYVGYRTQSGVPLGACRILVTRFTMRDGTPLPPGEEGQVIRTSGNAVGKVYSFEQQLKGGRNVLDLKLEEAVDEQPAPSER